MMNTGKNIQNNFARRSPLLVARFRVNNGFCLLVHNDFDKRSYLKDSHLTFALVLLN